MVSFRGKLVTNGRTDERTDGRTDERQQIYRTNLPKVGGSNNNKRISKVRIAEIKWSIINQEINIVLDSVHCIIFWTWDREILANWATS